MTKMDLESVRQFVLSDEEIKEYILSLAGKENLRQSVSGAEEFHNRVPMRQASPKKELENRISLTESENAILHKELKALREQAAALEKECASLREAMLQAEAQKDAAQKKLAAFEPIDSAMEIYRSLDEASKAAMRPIFRAVSPDGFICCGTQKDSLANLWDYGRTLAAYGSEDCLKIDQLFAYFVSLYNLTFERPVYALIEPQIGDRFDEDVHVCLMRGKRIAAVSGVLLRGYRINGKTVNKALVK